jgi:hypothetical protein
MNFYFYLLPTQADPEPGAGAETSTFRLRLQPKVPAPAPQHWLNELLITILGGWMQRAQKMLTNYCEKWQI